MDSCSDAKHCSLEPRLGTQIIYRPDVGQTAVEKTTLNWNVRNVIFYVFWNQQPQHNNFSFYYTF